MNSQAKVRNLQDILSEKQLNCILSKHSNGSQIIKHDVRSASEGISGFLGDHFRVTLHVKAGDQVKIVHLFVKTVPYVNAPKAQFIDDNKFFERESLTFKLFEDFPETEFSDSQPWGIKALIYSHRTLVLPDLSWEGYKTYSATQYLDLNHVLVTLTSLARFHAAFANYQTQTMENNSNYTLPKVYGCYLRDFQFCDGSWLRATIKVTTNFLKEFSTNIDKYPTNLEESITKWCLNACKNLREYENTLNVIIHKDLWANNILFKYSGDEPVNAVLIDFQCARYAPPAIDVMLFLYYTTSKQFREHYENTILDHYYSVFAKSVDITTKRRMDQLKYTRQAFFDLCDNLRHAGMIVPVAIYPFILMSPTAAQDSFDDPQTFQEHFTVDRCAPVLGYARENEYYKIRVLELFEEFVEVHLDKSTN